MEMALDVEWAHAIAPGAAIDLVESIGTKPVGEVVEGELRFPLVVRLPEKLRSPDAIGSILVSTTGGERIPLSRLAFMLADADVPWDAVES